MKHWTPYQPNADAPWNTERVVHLHRRAAFAATWNEVQRDLKDSPDAAIERLLTGHSQLKQSDDFTKMANNIGDAAMASNSPGRLRAWWFYRMLNTTDPLGERLALMWHSHFATSNRKVKNLVWMREQNEIFREHGRGPFGELLSNVVKHPAMLKWLDADANRKGHPNENLARELLELFTLGISNYTESDVLDSARALTGWMIKDDKFAYRTSRHDEGELTVLGKTQKMNGDDLLSLTLQHPATAKRIAWRLCDHFMGEKSYDDGAIDELAKGLVKNDFDINSAVATILRSNLFFAAKNLRTRITGPSEHVVAILRALELTDPSPSTMLLADWVSRMGQDLFYPPNVGGWTGGRGWMNSRSIIARANFGAQLASGKLWRSRDTDQMESTLAALLKRHEVDSSHDAKCKWLATLVCGKVQDGMLALVKESKDADHPMVKFVSGLLANPEYTLA